MIKSLMSVHKDFIVLLLSLYVIICFVYTYIVYLQFNLFRKLAGV